MNDELMFMVVVSDSVLFYVVAERENVGDCSLTIPYSLLVSFDLYLLAHDHGAAIALQADALVGFEDVGHQLFVTDQIDTGLAVQQYDLSQIKVMCGNVFLLEQFCDPRLQLRLYLRELESRTIVVQEV
jgi:hypothetical protein